MKNRIKLITLFLLIFISSNILIAQTTTKEITSEFFNLYENSPNEAFNFLTKSLPDENRKLMKDSQKNFIKNIDKLGAYNGYEKINEKSIGSSLKLIIYILKYDMVPVRITNVFYKPKDKWILRSINLDINLTKELKESGKVIE